MNRFCSLQCGKAKDATSKGELKVSVSIKAHLPRT